MPDTRYKILVVDDLEENRYTLCKILQNPNYEFIEAHDGLTALDQMRRHQPDLVLLDIRMPGIDGFSICERLREQWPHIPIVFVTANLKDFTDQVRGFEKGGDDYVIQPYDPQDLRIKVKALLRNKKLYDNLLKEIEKLNATKEHLAQSNEELQAVNQRLKETNSHLESLSVTDPITALFNRKYFHQRLEKEISATRRYQFDSAVIFIDLEDYFEKLTLWGELQMNVLLKEMASLLVNSVRSSDVVTRYEGGRFALILTHTAEPNAMTKARMIHEAIDSYPFPVYDDLLPEHHQPPPETTVHLKTTMVVSGLSHEWIVKPADILKALEISCQESRKLGSNRLLYARAPSVSNNHLN